MDVIKILVSLGICPTKNYAEVYAKSLTENQIEGLHQLSKTTKGSFKRALRRGAYTTADI